MKRYGKKGKDHVDVVGEDRWPRMAWNCKCKWKEWE